MTTSSLTAAPARGRRPTDPACPPWCAGHQGNYQDWYDLQDGTTVRDHASVLTIIGGYAVSVEVVERSASELGTAQVNLDRDVVTAGDLTTGEAHELGLALVRAGDTIRRWEETR